MMSLKTEARYPWVVAVLVGVLWFFYGPRLPADEKEFLAAALSLGAILTGFIATAKAILAALPSGSVMQDLRESGYVEELVKYLQHALYGCLFFSAFCLAGFFLISTPAPSLPRWYASCWIAAGVFGLLAFHRVSRLLFKIIKRPHARA